MPDFAKGDWVRKFARKGRVVKREHATSVLVRWDDAPKDELTSENPRDLQRDDERFKTFGGPAKDTDYNNQVPQFPDTPNAGESARAFQEVYAEKSQDQADEALRPRSREDASNKRGTGKPGETRTAQDASGEPEPSTPEQHTKADPNRKTTDSTAEDTKPRSRKNRKSRSRKGGPGPKDA